MTDIKRVKEAAAELKLSLEALSTVGKRKVLERSLTEALADWRDKPLRASPALLETLKPKESPDV